MIEYINKRLLAWAAWCKRKEDGGLGFPSQSNYCSMTQVRGTASAGAVTRFAAEEEIESIIVRIRREAPAQWDVANWFYLKGSLTKKRIAEELKCSEVTVYNRLHALHIAVMEALNDIEIEAEDRAYALRQVEAIAISAKAVVVVRQETPALALA
jgi:purine nucleoside permease